MRTGRLLGGVGVVPGDGVDDLQVLRQRHVGAPVPHGQPELVPHELPVQPLQQLAGHRLVREIADQPVASELLERLHGQLVRHQFRLAMRDGRTHVSLPEHLAIIDGIAGRDPAAAEAAARAHLSSVITALLESDG